MPLCLKKRPLEKKRIQGQKSSSVEFSRSAEAGQPIFGHSNGSRLRKRRRQMTRNQNDAPKGGDQTAEAAQFVPANDNERSPKPGERWRCKNCNEIRANPYGRPYLDDVARIVECGQCPDIILLGIPPDRAALIRRIIASDLL
jgi:hypothetical protein